MNVFPYDGSVRFCQRARYLQSMTAIAEDTLHAARSRYPQHAVFSQVENDRIETLPTAFRDGTYLWKDVEWVVRWYCRRPLGEADRTAESAFRENAMDDIRSVIDTIDDASGVTERVESLTTLAGVDVPIASAFLQFIDPESFAVVGPRAWRTLYREDALATSYPESVTAPEYATYLRECHGIAATVDMSLIDVGRALWVLDVEDGADVETGRHR